MRKEVPQMTFPADPHWRIGIVASTYYKEEIDALVAGAQKTLMEAGIPEANISVHAAPGSFEVPLIGQWVARLQKVDALIGFGIIVEGATHHAAFLAEQAARGIMDVQLQHSLPFAFEILYVDNLEQARERCFGDNNKGVEAATAVLASLNELKKLKGKNS